MTDVVQHAVDDWSLLGEVAGRLSAADTMDATLQALRLPAPAAEHAETRLWTIDVDASDRATGLTVVGVLAAHGQPARGEVGQRQPVPEIPLRSLSFLGAPGIPALISSIAEDPRVDTNTRERWLSLGFQSLLTMALALRGRPIGLLTIHWTTQVDLGPRQQRMYQALAGHTALLLDNLVMRERQQILLLESQRERRLLNTVMDHVPVGLLCIEGTSRRPLLTNRTARIMLAGSPDPVFEPLPLQHMLHPGTDTPVASSDLAGVRASVTGETQYRDLDLLPPGGQRMSVETIGVPVLDEHGNVDSVVVVMTDITGRKQAAEEKARLQEAIIAAQAAALVERSTPLIPITDDVLVMPLIGTLDRERGLSLLETALHGARERRAKVTILDITGVPALDAHAVDALLQTAGALRLLGVLPILSGVRPAVAAALVELDAQLAGVVTCNSLQTAIEVALRRLGKRF